MSFGGSNFGSDYLATLHETNGLPVRGAFNIAQCVMLDVFRSPQLAGPAAIRQKPSCVFRNWSSQHVGGVDGELLETDFWCGGSAYRIANSAICLNKGVQRLFERDVRRPIVSCPTAWPPPLSGIAGGPSNAIVGSTAWTGKCPKPINQIWKSRFETIGVRSHASWPSQAKFLPPLFDPPKVPAEQGPPSLSLRAPRTIDPGRLPRSATDQR